MSGAVSRSSHEPAFQRFGIVIGAPRKLFGAAHIADAGGLGWTVAVVIALPHLAQLKRPARRSMRASSSTLISITASRDLWSRSNSVSKTAA